MCAGSPPPSPVGSQGSQITDPATQIKGSDQYQVGGISGTSPNSVNTTNGAVTVNTFGAPGSSSNSGQQSGDNGPASSSSTGNNSGSASGGGDCNTPPVCSGDAVNCGILRETWSSMCMMKTEGDQLHKDLAGDGTQSPPDGGQHVGSEVTDGPIDLGDTSQLNSTGLGWGTACPFSTVSYTLLGTTGTISFQPVCDYGSYMRGFVLLLAAVTCAGVLGGFKFAPFGGGGGGD
ncbi:virulence factor TspB C-terminal domain-related protein [Dyella sp.]|uniref:virulence factor TspB C-terminal domain-related protein n=1 Tax=Dyella sp. TaxID=1869338 RepID=UPI0028479CA5|nr:virulence factor TspB C-terminal domain-related protein [Dyella sp.]MDR3443707.1 virulence factor TspB C-terminal domain-related protein [Dyella sp.]